MSCKSQSVRIALLWSTRTSARHTHCGDRNRSKKKSVPRNVKRGTFRKLNPPFLPFPLRGGARLSRVAFPSSPSALLRPQLNSLPPLPSRLVGLAPRDKNRLVYPVSPTSPSTTALFPPSYLSCG